MAATLDRKIKSDLICLSHFLGIALITSSLAVYELTTSLCSSNSARHKKPIRHLLRIRNIIGDLLTL